MDIDEFIEAVQMSREIAKINNRAMYVSEEPGDPTEEDSDTIAATGTEPATGVAQVKITPDGKVTLLA